MESIKYFDFTESCQNWNITVILRSNIDKPKWAGLFINIWDFLISMANEFPVKSFAVW